jgi:luciferase family oxidoreductase group 1
MDRFSVLDLSPVNEGATASEALHNSGDLGRHVEAWGYHRFWLAEHHNMPGIASAATAVVVAYIAGLTQTIRVGAGGVMLPNHAPLVIAEQFGTLEALYPGRIDLGLGRAPGTDPSTAAALRRDLHESADRFPQDVLELMSYFEPTEPGQRIRAVPGAGLRVPIWLLGSSQFSAKLAAMLGLPFAFASHFAPFALIPALEVYRSEFKPSRRLARPYAMVAVNIIAADTESEARRLFTSLQQSFLALRRGNPGQLPPPVDDMSGHWTPDERASVDSALAVSFVGTARTLRRGLEALANATHADEIMISSHIYDHAARLRSFEITSGVGRRMAAARRTAA